MRRKSIEKVNVKLAMALLHESTINGLQVYGFSDTAKALHLFAKFWSILNVKTPSIGKHKRDITRDPIRSANDWKLQYLLDFHDYVSFWKSSMVGDKCNNLILSRLLINSQNFYFSYGFHF